MTIREHLESVISRIEQTSLTESEKDKLYQMIQVGFLRTVKPVLLRFMPKDDFDRLIPHPETATWENYYDLVNKTFSQKEAVEDLEKLMHGILDVVENNLREAKVI